MATVDDILSHSRRYTDPKDFRVVMMDFKITPARPDGIKVEAEFWVETWDDLHILMNRLELVEAEVV